MNNPIKVAIKLRTSTIVERFSLNSLVMFFYLKYNFSDKIFKGIELFLGSTALYFSKFYSFQN